MFIDAIVLAQFAIQWKCVTIGAQVQAAMSVETREIATPLIAKWIKEFSHTKTALLNILSQPVLTNWSQN